MCARRLTLLLALIPAAAIADTSVRVAPVVPPPFRLLAEPAVVKDLALTAPQQQAVDQLRRCLNSSAQDLYLGLFGMVPADVLRAGVTQQINDFLAHGLTKDQRARLEQIAFQLREREFGPHQAFAMAARDLGLRPDQLEDVRNLKGQRVEEIANAVTSGKRFEKVKAEVSATNGETFEKMAEMLTRAQRERLRELRGRAFVLGDAAPKAKPSVASPIPEPGPTPRIQMPEVAPPPNFRVILDRYPAELFGVYDIELRYLDTVSVQSELKFNLDQVRKIELALRAWSEAHLALPGLDLNRAGRLHDRTARAIDEILKPEQRRRLGEIMMQRRALVSPEAMCGHPAAVERLKLTPNQLQQLRYGRLVADVLSEDQLAARKELLGRPFQLPIGVVDPLIDRVAPEPSAEARIVVPSVQYSSSRDFLLLTDRLQLTPGQVKKLRNLAEDEPRIRELIQQELSLDNTPPVAGAGRSVTAVNSVTELYREAVEKQCWDVLDPQQQSTAKKIFGRGRN